SCKFGASLFQRVRTPAASIRTGASSAPNNSTFKSMEFPTSKSGTDAPLNIPAPDAQQLDETLGAECEALGLVLANFTEVERAICVLTRARTQSPFFAIRQVFSGGLRGLLPFRSEER